jgi:hypothetical protein
MAACALLVVLAPELPAQVRVERWEERLTVTARGATLRQVLDRLARETGMKVHYEGLSLAQPIDAVLPDHTPAEAVLALLEGQGLNYALAMDASGTRVDTLIFSERTAASARPLPGPAGTRRERGPRSRPVPRPVATPRPPAERPAPAQPAEPAPRSVPSYPRSPFTPGLDTTPPLPGPQATPQPSRRPNRGNEQT